MSKVENLYVQKFEKIKEMPERNEKELQSKICSALQLYRASAGKGFQPPMPRSPKNYPRYLNTVMSELDKRMLFVHKKG